MKTPFIIKNYLSIKGQDDLSFLLFEGGSTESIRLNFINSGIYYVWVSQGNWRKKLYVNDLDILEELHNVDSLLLDYIINDVTSDLYYAYMLLSANDYTIFDGVNEYTKSLNDYDRKNIIVDEEGIINSFDRLPDGRYIKVHTNIGKF